MTIAADPADFGAGNTTVNSDSTAMTRCLASPSPAWHPSAPAPSTRRPSASTPSMSTSFGSSSPPRCSSWAQDCSRSSVRVVSWPSRPSWSNTAALTGWLITRTRRHLVDRRARSERGTTVRRQRRRRARSHRDRRFSGGAPDRQAPGTAATTAVPGAAHRSPDRPVDARCGGITRTQRARPVTATAETNPPRPRPATTDTTTAMVRLSARPPTRPKLPTTTAPRQWSPRSTRTMTARPPTRPPPMATRTPMPPCRRRGPARGIRPSRSTSPASRASLPSRNREPSR